MTIDLFWVDLFAYDKLFGFGLGTVKTDKSHRSLLSVYYNDGEVLLDMLWFNIYQNHPFWFWKFIYKGDNDETES